MLTEAIRNLLSVCVWYFSVYLIITKDKMLKAQIICHFKKQVYMLQVL